MVFVSLHRRVHVNCIHTQNRKHVFLQERRLGTLDLDISFCVADRDIFHPPHIVKQSRQYTSILFDVM